MKTAVRLAAQALGAVVAILVLAALRDAMEPPRTRGRPMATSGAASGNGVATAAALAHDNDDLEAIHAAIDAQNDVLVQALCSGDVAAYSLTFAPDALSLPANGPILYGRDAIADMIFETFKSVRYVRAEVETTQLMVSDGFAYEIGNFDFDLEVKRKRRNSQGRYLMVWRKIGERWLIVRDVGQPGAAAA